MNDNNDFHTNFIDLNEVINEHIQDDIYRWLFSIKFDSYAYVVSPRNGNDFFILNGFNFLWKKHYTEYQFHKIDPILAKARNYQCPYIWSSVNLSIDNRFLNCAKKHGVRFGYSVSLPLNEDYLSVLSIVRNNDAFISRKDSVSTIGMMYIYLQKLNDSSQAYINTMNSKQLIIPRLTKREQECLQWVAEGKTNWEISKILSISERTVIFHVNNCMAKLDSKNRVQAITKAMRVKIIT
ncbi:Transcriptional activator protein luxR [Buttiauxella agrestis]|uniref:Transcriptional activator protein luxR n=1 Tax=Buttiauxella agrestis TaxID=82977 RepID=A0A381KQ57_9ENTR|nr:LuxR family transcriptional regulator [Buttiauxella agrestis]SUY92937.1 Transcriptional activator protein luxR [Buttiauxella agrestis]